jgi:hypothetical protein
VSSLRDQLYDWGEEEDAAAAAVEEGSGAGCELVTDTSGGVFAECCSVVAIRGVLAAAAADEGGIVEFFMPQPLSAEVAA